MYSSVVFFFQAEDGIRDADVTGVQTCALPIWMLRRQSVEDVNRRHPVPADGAAPRLRRMVGYRIGPLGIAFLGIGVKQEPVRAAEVAAIDDELARHLVV